MAIFHAAIHDALNAIDERYQPYTPGLTAAPGASVDAAAAAAARDVLVTLLPDQATMVETAYQQALAAIPEGAGKDSAILTGQMAAAANIARRQGDGSENGAQPVHEPRPGPGEYQFTPPFNFAMADGFIAGFEAKYRFRFWRPETAIRAAATDGQPVDDPGRGVAAVLDYAARPGSSIDPHRARMGRGASVDRTSR